MKDLLNPVSPAYAIEFDSFKDGLNQAFGKQATNDNAFNFFIVVVLIALVVFILSMLLKKEEQKAAAQKRLSVFKLKKSDPKRQFFRASLDIEVLWSYADKDKKVFNSAVAINLSGGGFCFRTNEFLKAGQQINVHMDIGEENPLLLPSKVVRAKPVTWQDENMYEVAVQFDNLSTREQDKIMGYVMSFERENIRNLKFNSNQEINIVEENGKNERNVNNEETVSNVEEEASTVESNNQ